MKLGIVTPVWQRQELTALCLDERIMLLQELPFDAVQIVIGDDPHLRDVVGMLAHSFGQFEWVEAPNDYLGRKFNAGYQRAKELGCTHVIAIGSDSWLHPLAFEGREFSEKHATALTGLSTFSPDGLVRLDLEIKYPAGFGVGMVYPVSALQDEPCGPLKQKGCDSSTWSRNGKGRLGVQFDRAVPLAYTNFSSHDVQVTSFRQVHKTHGLPKRGARIVTGHHVFDELRPMYGDELVDSIEGFYVARALGHFLQQQPTPEQISDKPTIEMVKVRKEPLSVADARRHAEARRNLRAARRAKRLGVEDR